jgi:hypothetical protein
MITLLQITAGISGILERIISFLRSLISRIAQVFRGLFGSGSFDLGSLDLFGSQGPGQGSDTITAGNTTIESAAAPAAAGPNWFNLILAVIIFAAVVFAIIYVWQRHIDKRTKKEVLGSLRTKKEKKEKGPEKEEIAQITAEAVVKALLQSGFLHVTPTLNVEKVPKNESDFIDLTEQQEEEG